MYQTLAEAIEKSVAPWTEVLDDLGWCVVYYDKYPVTDGHILFVPKLNTQYAIEMCLVEAYRWGNRYIKEGKCDAFNVGLNNGESAGQTVMYPHIHLIPRRKGDMINPRGGVRHVIPEKGKY